MPSWKPKDRRQYEHIKESSRERGESEGRAKEIAARTVNKQRRQEQRTPNRETQGTGNPKVPLEERTRQQLQNRASELKIKGYSKMKKGELVEALKQRQS